VEHGYNPPVCRSTSVDEWSDFTERNLTEAEKQRRNSVRLRAVADGVLQTSCNDINRQRSDADLALQMRVNELRDAKEKFEDHLNKVNDYILLTLLLDVVTVSLGRVNSNQVVVDSEASSQRTGAEERALRKSTWRKNFVHANYVATVRILAKIGVKSKILSIHIFSVRKL